MRLINCFGYSKSFLKNCFTAVRLRGLWELDVLVVEVCPCDEDLVDELMELSDIAEGERRAILVGTWRTGETARSTLGVLSKSTSVANNKDLCSSARRNASR